MDGAPKGLERVGGERMIDRVARALAEATDSLLVVANDPVAGDWLRGVQVVADATPGLGALGGIHTALEHAGTDVIVVAWDMPFVPGAVLSALRAEGERGGAHVVAPASASPWGFEPLAAWYAAAARPHVAAMLDAGERRAGRIADRAGLVTCDVTSWGDPDEMLLSVNTPDDLARAGAVAARMRARDDGA